MEERFSYTEEQGGYQLNWKSLSRGASPERPVKILTMRD
jgi:hypothetical protein